MLKIQITILLSLFLISCKSQTNSEIINQTSHNSMEPKIIKTDAEWKTELTPEQFQILREKGTEYPGTGAYYLNFDKGTYVCAACGTPLFKSDNKFESSCGWPSFDDAIPGKVEYKKDTSHGMIRTEILCATCGGHLGHIFDDGPQETTGKRYCVNSLSLDFEKE